MLRTTALSFLALTFLTLSLSPADPPPPQYHPHYLKPDAIDVVALLPPPPPADSPEHAAEFDLLIKLQETRTPEDVARATAEERGLTVFAFADVLGPNFTPARCPKTAAFFKTAMNDDLAYFNKLAKYHWQRPRPHTDPRIHSLFKETDASYPSGHSIRATLTAELLSALLPDQRTALTARSQQMGWDREIAGVHFPTDIFAGRILGLALAHSLLNTPDFRSQLDSLKPELQQALVTTPDVPSK